ncbi:hypothetical protein HGRIS_002274 [Hohenbuehelia grisea]|uniref:ATP-NAD kinase n=1 Tax=Hohenbuehelia grisea TaxID=104357 RepID=A0ABR3JKQ2_9AGAR
MPAVTSPDAEYFATPPTTPGPTTEHHHTLTRRNRSSLNIDVNHKEGWKSDVVLVEHSPEIAKKMNRTPIQSPASLSVHAPHPPSSVQDQPKSTAPYHKPMVSPCFVHSLLDKGGSLTDWLRHQHQPAGEFGVTVAKTLQQNGSIHTERHQLNHVEPTVPSPLSTESMTTDDDDYDAGSLTRQLAETAVGVREMSKQLGRARVRSNIQNVLVITKARDNRLIKLTRELAIYLMMKRQNGRARGLTVYVDHQLRHSRRFDAEGIERDHPEFFVPFAHRRTSSNSSVSSASTAANHIEEEDLKDAGQLRYWTSDMCSHSPHLFDFVVTLGGDGTVLFTSWLFQRIVPPVLPFALGSLGFLTNFDFADHQAVMDSVIESGIRVNLRMRFTCTVYRAVATENGKRRAVKKGETGEIMMKNVEKGGWEALEGGWSGNYGHEASKAKDKEIMCFTTRAVETFEVLNDLVVDRGPSPYVSLLELFGDEHHMTTVQADGLTVSTPTGSTAYSLSAGGSLVHPEIPAILITPICPHTLSFRPMLLPDSMELRICVPFNSRSTAWASFDGRGRVELKQGDHIKVTASKYPFPTVCADKQSTDWFHAISRTLKWNERERQKSFVVVEEGPEKRQRRRRSNTTTPERVQKQHEMGNEDEEIDEEEDECSDEEEEEAKFDIDDSSPEAASKSSESKSTDELSSDAEVTGREKARELRNMEHKSLSEALKQGYRRSKSRSRSRSGVRSGVHTPGRFAGPQPHPPRVSPRHVEFSNQSSPESTDYNSGADDGQRGTRDDLHAPRRTSAKSRIPFDRDLEADVKTPTASQSVYGRSRSHGRTASLDQHPPRAFAAWGHDESDSNASDSDA